MASGRPIQVRQPTSAPIANVIAASWKAGIFPVATVKAASSDHIRIAVSPISVAVREVIVLRHSGAQVKRASPESITTIGSMDFGPAPSSASRNDKYQD